MREKRDIARASTNARSEERKTGERTKNLFRAAEPEEMRLSFSVIIKNSKMGTT